MARPRTIAELAEAIADGRTVDWESAESSAPTDWERAAIQRLRRIGHVSERRRRPAAPTQPSHGLDAAVDAASSERQWGHLTILEPVGEGAFGQVYRAHDPKLARDVALKLLRESASMDRAGKAVIEEGRLLARVRHPNVATVYGADRVDGCVGIWMEFIHGRTLEQVLGEHGPFDAGEVTRIGIDLCRALGAVHQAGLVHRDVKAQNVMREDGGGRLVLMDFGTGRERERAGDAVEQLTGTPLYLAPEVLDGETATVRSDIYSLGVLLYHLATGSYPLRARTLGELVAAHRANARRPLSHVRPDLPPAFVKIVEQATAVDAERRYATTGEMEGALSATLARGARLRQWVAAHPGQSSAAAILAVTLMASLAWLIPASPITPSSPTVGVPPAQRARVLIADFDTPPNDPKLGARVKAWLEQALGGSRVVDVVNRMQTDDILKLMRRDVDSPISAEVAQEICERDEGIHLYVTGAVERAGTGYVLRASLFTSDGRSVGGAHEPAAAEAQIIPATENLASRIRELAGESRADINRTREDALRVTTESMEAYRLYKLAYSRRDSQDWPKSLGLIDDALQHDSVFPSAHIWRAWALWHAHKDRGLNTKEEARAEATLAMDRRDRVASEWERHWIEGSYGSITGDLELAAAAYKALLALYPTHDWAVGNLDNVTGRLNRPFEAVPYAADAADRRPYDRLAVEEAVFATLEAGDVSRARQNMERLRAIRANSADDVTAAEARTVEAWAAWQRGEMKEARQLLDQVVPALSSPSGWTIRGRRGTLDGLVRLYLALGRPEDVKHVATFMKDDGRQFTMSLASYWQQDDPALRTSLPVKVNLDTPNVGQLVPEEWTMMLLQAGHMGEAQRRVDFAAGQHPTPGGPSFLVVLQARLMKSRGNHTRALELLLPTPAAAEASPLYLADRADILAGLQIEQGKPKDAMDTLRAAKWTLATSNCFTPPLGMKNLARLAELELHFGDPAEAGRIEAELRKLLAEAEPDFPLVKRVRETGHGG